jgi:hypothetical protein
METPWLAIPPIALRRTGRLRPSTVWSLLAEFRPKIGRGREGDHTGDDLLSVTKARLEEPQRRKQHAGLDRMTGWSRSREKENFKPALLGHDIETTIASADPPGSITTLLLSQ